MLKLEQFQEAKKRVDEVIINSLIYSEAFSKECKNEVYIKPMPKHTPLIKVEATQSHGAEVVLAGEVYDDSYNAACKLQKEKGYTFVHPFNDEDVIEGQGTIALEILEELPNADIILVPVGGGGLISGIACAAKAIKPTIKIIGVEPEGAASALAAINEDQVVALKEAVTIADGTAVKQILYLSRRRIRNGKLCSAIY